MQRSPFRQALIAAGMTIALACAPCLVRAQASEVSLSLPLAVGGPAANGIDDKAAAFGKRNK